MAVIRKPSKKTDRKVVPKKPKALKISKEPKVPKIKKADVVMSTALARIEPEVIVPIQHSATFIRAAERLDEKIVKSVDRWQKDVIAIGEMFDEMRATSYWQALKDQDGNNFIRFTDYIEERYPERSKTQVFQAMSIVKNLTSGDNPTVPREDVREMPRDNANALVKMKKAQVTITAELIQDAKTMNVATFRREIVDRELHDEGKKERSARSNRLSAEPETILKRVLWLSPAVAAKLDEAMALADRLTPGEPAATKDDRLIEAICTEFIETWRGEGKELDEAEDRRADHAAQVTEDELAILEEVEGDGVEAVGEDEASAKEYNKPRECIWVKPDGAKCKSFAKGESDYCVFHPPASERMAEQGEGEQASA